MSSMRSFLIIGGTKEERLAKAESLKPEVKREDKIFLKSEMSLGINDVRRLQHRLYLKPYSSAFNVAIIPEAEKLTFPAQNAMLKLLEEPPENTIIILCSFASEALLPTVVSRCQMIKLPSKSRVKIDKSLVFQSKKLIRNILRTRMGERIKMAGEIAKSRQQAIEFCQTQLIVWREIMLKEVNKDKKKEFGRIIREIDKALKMLEANTNPKLVIEDLLLKY
jgi:DNA polymerase III delta prime subunit